MSLMEIRELSCQDSGNVQLLNFKYLLFIDMKTMAVEGASKFRRKNNESLGQMIKQYP